MLSATATSLNDEQGEEDVHLSLPFKRSALFPEDNETRNRPLLPPPLFGVDTPLDLIDDLIEDEDSVDAAFLIATLLTACLHVLIALKVLTFLFYFILFFFFFGGKIN
jgi:hypothetical protein